MSEITKNSSLNALLNGIETIDLATAETGVINDYMDATKTLDAFTKRVKEEIKTRLEAGEEVEKYILATKTTKKIEDEHETYKSLLLLDLKLGLNLEREDIYDQKMKSAKELAALVGTKNAGKIGIVESKTTFIKRKRGK